MRKFRIYSIECTILLLFLFYILNFTFYIPEAFAHTLKSDGNISAIFHTDPDDNPVAGDTTQFFFEFKDTQNKFNPKDCFCVVTIKNSSGKELLTQNLFRNNPSPSLTDSSFSYTFPLEDAYEVTVTGKPKTNDEFQSFTLSYDIRVDTTSQSAGNQNFFSAHYLHLAAGIIILVFCIIALIKKPKE